MKTLLLFISLFYKRDGAGEVKNSRGNREAKELIGTTDGHELRGGWNAGGWGVTGFLSLFYK